MDSREVPEWLREAVPGPGDSPHLGNKDDTVNAGQKSASRFDPDPAGFDPSGGDPKGATVVAAFEPFAGRPTNRSWEAVARLPPSPGLIRLRLPVDFRELEGHIDRIRDLAPRFVLLVGESSARDVRAEGIALNILDSSRPDNAGRTVQDVPLIPGAPLALRTRWDPVGVAAALKTAGIRATASFHGGTYACNAALYLALHGLPPSTRIGFLHIPRRRWLRGPRIGTLIRSVTIALTHISQGIDSPVSQVERAPLQTGVVEARTRTADGQPASTDPRTRRDPT